MNKLIGELFWFFIDEYEKRMEVKEYNEMIYDINKVIKDLELIIKS